MVDAIPFALSIAMGLPLLLAMERTQLFFFFPNNLLCLLPFLTATPIHVLNNLGTLC